MEKTGSITRPTRVLSNLLLGGSRGLSNNGKMVTTIIFRV